MQEILHLFTPTAWFWILMASFMSGLSKGGLRGMDMLGVTIMALVFGSKSSTGIVLPLLCVADIAAVIYYHRHAQWDHFWKLIPWMAIGILFGVFIGKDMNEALFRKFMAVIILITIAIVLFMEYRKSQAIPTHPLFAISTGLTAGFTTMLGNLAGAFSNLYFLAMRLPKNSFIGTASWIFLIMNWFKLPFQIFYWKNITFHSIKIDLILFPTLFIGFWLGVKLVGKFQEEKFRKIVMTLTLIGSMLMLLRK